MAYNIHHMKRLTILLNVFFLCSLLLILFTKSNVLELEPKDKVHIYSRMMEFEYVTWTLNALNLKWVQANLSVQNFLDDSRQYETVKTCVNLIDELDNTRYQIEMLYADPAVQNPAEASADLVKNRDLILAEQSHYQPLCEEILQQQISSALHDLGLTSAGQPLPPLLYHVTPLPMAIIISPRNHIKQEQNISLLADLNTEDIDRLEKQVEENLGVSALVVPVGGVGVYPTMVYSSTDLAWQLDTISHEWIHNYLTLRPLGLNYETNSELRTMNETTASLAGQEISRVVLQRYYPQLLPPPQTEETEQPAEKDTPQETPAAATPPPFNYYKEMHITRVRADELLSENKIDEAEEYMESRRIFFWENGYHIRRLNQAYFAFYGAYADNPQGGAAGRDPVGPAVRQLRQQSSSLLDFLNKISKMTSFEELQRTITKN